MNRRSHILLTSYPKWTEQSSSYLKLLVQSIKPFVYMLLLCGIDIRLNFKVVDLKILKKKPKSTICSTAEALYTIYRVILLVWFMFGVVGNVNLIFLLYHSEDFPRNVITAAFISIFLSTLITYIYFIINGKRISDFLSRFVLDVAEQMQENCKYVEFKTCKIKLRNWSILLLFLVAFIFIPNFYMSSSSFFRPNVMCKTDHLLINLGFKCPSISFKIANFLGMSFNLAIVIPLMISFLNLFCFLIICAIYNFDMLCTFYQKSAQSPRYDSCLKLFVHKHGRSSILVTHINEHFSFLVFVWFFGHLIILISLIRVVTGNFIIFADVFLMILFLAHFLLECLLISSLNSKASMSCYYIYISRRRKNLILFSILIFHL